MKQSHTEYLEAELKVARENFWTVVAERDRLRALVDKIRRQPEDGKIDDSRTLGLIDALIADALKRGEL